MEENFNLLDLFPINVYEEFYINKGVTLSNGLSPKKICNTNYGIKIIYNSDEDEFNEIIETDNTITSHDKFEDLALISDDDLFTIMRNLKSYCGINKE